VRLYFLFKHPSSKNHNDVRPFHGEYFISIWIIYHRFESFEIPSHSLLYNMYTTRVSWFCVFVIRFHCTILFVSVCLCLCYRKLIKSTIIIKCIEGKMLNTVWKLYRQNLSVYNLNIKTTRAFNVNFSFLHVRYWRSRYIEAFFEVKKRSYLHNEDRRDIILSKKSMS